MRCSVVSLPSKEKASSRLQLLCSPGCVATCGVPMVRTDIHATQPTLHVSLCTAGGSAFDTLMGSDDEDEEPAPPPASSKSKKKDKKGKAAKSAFSGLLSDDDAEEEPKAEDKEVNLLTAPVDSLEGIEQVTTALALTGISKTRKQNLKQRLKKLEVCQIGLAVQGVLAVGLRFLL